MSQAQLARSWLRTLDIRVENLMAQKRRSLRDGICQSSARRTVADRAQQAGGPLSHSSDNSTDWWDDRMDAIESVLGRSDGMVSHSSVPFEFGYDAGGRADVVHFREYVPGIVYVTSELIGDDRQIRNGLGNYELAICHRTEETWGAETISSLAYCTLNVKIEPSETMSIGSIVPADSTISAFLFSDFGRFTVRGREAGLLLCVGITPDELAACRRGDLQNVEANLRSRNVYPFTDLQRRSVLI